MPRRSFKNRNPLDDDQNTGNISDERDQEREETRQAKYNPQMTEEEAEQHFTEEATEVAAKEIDIPIIPPPSDGDSGSGSGGSGDGSGASGQGNSNVPMTLTESIESSSDMTDMQYAAHRLFPPKLGRAVYNANMIGRVDPTIYLSRLHLNAVDEIMTSDPRKPIDVNEVWNKHETLLSIGLDGMGRIDLLELAGAAREEKRIEKQFGSLGAG